MEKFNFVKKMIIRSNLNPNIVTFIGAIGTIGGSIILMFDFRFTAVLLITIFSLFDAIDGTIARLQNKQSDLGKFLDSNLDRIADTAIFLAIMTQLNTQEISTYYILISALGVSLITSYVQATAEIADIKILSGPLSRLPRIILLLIAIITQEYRNILIIILILGSITVFLRLYSGLMKIKGKS